MAERKLALFHWDLNPVTTFPQSPDVSTGALLIQPCEQTERLCYFKC